MKQIRIFWLVSVAAWGQSADTPRTIASTVDREVGAVERQIVDAAEAMPESTFNFSPESLHIPGSDYKGARSPPRSSMSPLPTMQSGPA